MQLPSLKYIRFAFRAIVTIGILAIIVLNIRLYAPLDCEKNEKSAIFKQLNYLQKQLERGADLEQQTLYPEGYIFANATYSLAWIDALRYTPCDTATYHRGVAEIQKAIAKINSPEAYAIFSAELAPKYGIFYNGWKAFTIGSFFELKPELKHHSALWDDYAATCEAIATAYDNAPTPYLESYEYGTWAGDNMVGIAAIAQYNRIDTAKYEATLRKWLHQTRQKLGIFPQTITRNGETDVGRGCTESLILSLLPDIDSAFADEEYAKYTQEFKDTHFGMPFLREYNHNTTGSGDIDSRPVLFDIGPVACLVGIKAARKNHDFELSEALRQSAECFGFAYANEREKYYLGGKLPIVDFFLAWFNADNARYQHDLQRVGNWRWKFQGYSLLFIALLSLLGWGGSLIRKCLTGFRTR